MANVSAGSMLNQRVFAKPNKAAGSSNSGGGVKRNTLNQARVIIGANRSSVGGARASYTSLSNQINGRKEVIYVGGNQGGCCGSSGSGTMEKIAAYMAIAQQGLTLAEGIKSLFSSSKSSAANNVDNAKAPKGSGSNNDIEKLNSSDLDNGSSGVSGTGSGVNDLASTIDMVSLTDIDYDGNADDFIDALNDADNSQELYQALQNAKVYKGQVNARIKSMTPEVSLFKKNLENITGDSEQSLKGAKKDLSKAKDEVSTAESTVKQNEQGVEAARKSYDSAKAQFESIDQDFKDLSQFEKDWAASYDESKKELSGAKQNKRMTQQNLDAALRSLDIANKNVASAKANYDAIKNLPPSEAKNAQLAQAKAQVEAAEKAQEAAKEQHTVADGKNTEAKNQVEKWEGSVKSIKASLAKCRAELKEMAEKLATSHKALQGQADLLKNRQTSLENSETLLENNQNKLDEKRDDVSLCESKVDKLELQKEELEVKIKDFEELQEASKDLDDLSKYETKLNKMLKKEGIKEKDLKEKLETYNTTSNNDKVSARKRKRAEKSEIKTTNKLAELYAGSAWDDIARDQDLSLKVAGEAFAESLKNPSKGGNNGNGNVNVNTDTVTMRGSDTGFDFGSASSSVPQESGGGNDGVQYVKNGSNLADENDDPNRRYYTKNGQV